MKRLSERSTSVYLSFEGETESKIWDFLLAVVQRQTPVIGGAGCRKQYDQGEQDKNTRQKHRQIILHKALPESTKRLGPCDDVSLGKVRSASDMPD